MSEPVELLIQGRGIGDDHPAFLIAEVAQAHDGSLGAAHAYIDIAADAGADAIKFQTHFADEESSLDEPFRVKFSRQDATRYDYWKRMEFTAEQWAGIAEHAAQRNIIFLSSAFSIKAIELLDRLGMPAWKIASGEVSSQFLLGAMCATRKPILLSSGMSSWGDLDQQVRYFETHGNPLAVMQCTSRYPTPLALVGQNVIAQMRERYRHPVGLSDHSGSKWPGIMAMANGAHMIEVHIALHKQQFGPDTAASLTPADLADLAAGRTAFHEMRRHPVDKDALAVELAATRQIFSRSLAPRRDLKAGTVLAKQDVAFRKPGSGIPEADLDQFVGRTLARDVSAQFIFKREDFL